MLLSHICKGLNTPNRGGGLQNLRSRSCWQFFSFFNIFIQIYILPYRETNFTAVPLHSAGYQPFTPSIHLFGF